MAKHAPQPALSRMRKASDAGIHPMSTLATQPRYQDAKPEHDRRQFQVRLPEDLLRELAIHCASEGETRQSVAERALAEYLERHRAP